MLCVFHLHGQTLPNLMLLLLPTDPSYLLGPGHQSHSLTVCANHSSSADLLQKVEQRARAMYESRAFLHWYWRHGCEEGDFQQSFEVLHSIIEDYHHLGD